MAPGRDDDFYVEDEPLDDVVAAFEAGEKGMTQNDATTSAEFPLTARERELLAYLSEGKSINEIARVRTLDEATVRALLARVFQKIGAA